MPPEARVQERRSLLAPLLPPFSWGGPQNMGPKLPFPLDTDPEPQMPPKTQHPLPPPGLHHSSMFSALTL